MIQRITHIAILVRDQDEALAFYTQKLGFEKNHDAVLPNGFRWLVVSPPDQKETGVVLMKADTPEALARVGKQTGGDISLMVMSSSDVRATYQAFLKQNVKILGEPMENSWGLAFQFQDLYGNKFDVFQPKG
jgi:catechol 2,3-dioxygenase-like lactoylglutathione lyase family enzyme